MATTRTPVVAVIGCGYVGLTTAVLFANCGITVRAIEINPERLATIKSGKSFFYEAGINPLLEKALADQTLVVTDSYEEAIPGASVVFSCVGTPDNADGSSNLTYVFEAAQTAAKLMAPGTVYAQKSTVPVGTGQQVSQLIGDRFAYVSNPEFLREGTAVLDTLWSDRVVAGGNPEAARQVLNLYCKLEVCRDAIAETAGLNTPSVIPGVQYITTDLASAELIKVTANAFLALKISFANSIAKLADQAGADVVQVMDAVGADRRIGRAFLNAGRGYGGGCFPKDVSGLIRSAEDYGVNMEIMKAASEVNDSMPHYLINRAQEAFGSSFAGVRVAVLGLAFKAGTSDVRRSPAIVIANTLADLGAHVTAYDPEAMDEARHDLDSRITLADGAEACLQSAACAFIATEWPAFADIPFEQFAGEDGLRLVVDGMNLLHKQALENSAIKILGIGHRVENGTIQ